MKHTLLTLALFAQLAAAAPVFAPLSPQVGAPGQVLGWDLAVTPDSTAWVAFTGSFILVESNPIGFYVDFIGPLGGPDSGVLPPSEVDAWLEDFDFDGQVGLGYYALDPAAPIGAFSSGNIRVLYELFSDDPRTCEECFVESSFVDLPFSVEVSDEVPEPATILLSAAGLVLIITRRRLQSTYAANVAGVMRRRPGTSGPDHSL